LSEGTYDPDRIRNDFDRIAELSPHGHDTNAVYHRHLLDHVPLRCESALDVGCGTGTFTRLLAERAARVDAIDLAPGMIAVARSRRETGSNIQFEVADFLERPLGEDHYDVIASIATLHHVPLATALTRLSTALKPGGTLVVLDLLDTSGIAELPANALAWLVARTHGVLEGWPRASAAAQAAWEEHGRRDRYESWRSVVRTYQALLPGARLTRHLLWRYSAVWRKAGLTPPGSRASSSTFEAAGAPQGDPRPAS
jgi:2-polyprenyl-3-methyl-5-hydroxy-6-metoxy-1,4-benzoquinol methylase